MDLWTYSSTISAILFPLTYISSFPSSPPAPPTLWQPVSHSLCIFGLVFFIILSTNSFLNTILIVNFTVLMGKTVWYKTVDKFVFTLSRSRKKAGSNSYSRNNLLFGMFTACRESWRHKGNACAARAKRAKESHVLWGQKGWKQLNCSVFSEMERYLLSYVWKLPSCFSRTLCLMIKE